MRREKTMKICANFYVAPAIAIKENAGSDRSWVWQCHDFSEEKTDLVTLAVRFANSENAQKFKEQFLDAQKVNKAIEEGNTPEAVSAPKEDAAKPKEDTEEESKQEEKKDEDEKKEEQKKE